MTEGLGDREREILVEVVELYLATGSPVSSAAVARRSATGLSSATIRNVMADLERAGYLRQPHTSAGRAPSDDGFRAYVGGLLGKVTLAPEEVRRLREDLANSGALEELLARVSRILSEVSEQVGVALAAVRPQVAVRSLHFVPVSDRRVLAIVVTRGGHVESRLLNVEQSFTLDELERISSYCAHSFGGMSLAEIRRRLLRLMAEERVRYDRLLAGVIELGERVTAFEQPAVGEVFLEGTEHLLERVQPHHLGAVRDLLAAFVDKARLVGLLNQLLDPAGSRVLFGSDFALDATGTLGMVLSPYELATGESGLVGVIGLKRMNYPQIIPVVDYVGNFLAAGSREEWRRSLEERR